MKTNCIKPIAVIVFIICNITFNSKAQNTRYLVKLKDKGTHGFSFSNPLAYLSQRAIDRRLRYNINIDSTDIPVNQKYIDSLRLAGNVEILNTSKWLNQVAIRTTDITALQKIQSFSFVVNVGGIAARNVADIPVNKRLDPEPPVQNSITTTTGLAYGKSNGQIKIHNGNFLHDRGFSGSGMQMSVMDAGFFRYKTLPTFDSVRFNNQILGTWDFVAKEANVDEDDAHGMQCLSTIAANLPGVFVGSANKMGFYLFRTEDVASEYPIEEQNFAAALERSDSLGVDVTSTSLGYNTFDNPQFNYTYAMMDGNSTISARAADLAAKKGMLMVIAAGNEGNRAWKFITTPADADSVLSVGAVDTLGNVASFSSYGPSSDGQIKPAVASVGAASVIASTSTGLPVFGNGTSFACPNMAGLSSCLWQAFPEVNNMAIISALQQSASRANNPNDRMGYGIPDMKKAFVLLYRKVYSATASINTCTVAFNIAAKTTNDIVLEIQRKMAGTNNYSVLKQLTSVGAFATRNFSFIDDVNNLSIGPVQYRIVAKIGTDTSFVLDSTLTVNYTQPCLPSVNSVVLKPNPVVNDLQIELIRTAPSGIVVSITNAVGQKVFERNFNQPSGTSIITIPMMRLAKGVYMVTVIADGAKLITKPVIK